MRKLDTSFEWSEATPNKITIGPSSSEYIWPQGWVQGQDYAIKANSNVKSVSGASLVPYEQVMVGAMPANEWTDRTVSDWWSWDYMDYPYGDKFDWSPPYDVYGNSYHCSAIYAKYMNELGADVYWLLASQFLSIRFTFTVANPGAQLWCKFDYADNLYGFTYGQPQILESGVAIPLTSISQSIDYIYNMSLEAADTDPWDFYSSPNMSMFSITKIELEVPGKLKGWVDITDVDYWSPVDGYGTWDNTNKVWSSEGVDSPGYWEVWLERKGCWAKGFDYPPNAGQRWKNSGIRPEKVRVFYEAADPSQVTELPGLYIEGEYSAPLTRFEFANTGYISGTEAELFFDDVGCQNAYDHTGFWDDIKRIDLYNGNGYNDFPYKVTKIEFFMEIPKYYPFKKLNYADSQDMAHNVDIIAPGFAFARDDDKGLYNIAQETSYDNTDYVSPIGTEWAVEGYDGINRNNEIGTNPSGLDFSIDNVADLYWDTWENAANSRPPNYVGKKAICHLIEPDIYLEFFFDQWTEFGEGGGFSYKRTRL